MHAWTDPDKKLRGTGMRACRAQDERERSVATISLHSFLTTLRNLFLLASLAAAARHFQAAGVQRNAAHPWPPSVPVSVELAPAGRDSTFTLHGFALHRSGAVSVVPGQLRHRRDVGRCEERETGHTGILRLTEDNLPRQVGITAMIQEPRDVAKALRVHHQTVLLLKMLHLVVVDSRGPVGKVRGLVGKVRGLVGKVRGLVGKVRGLVGKVRGLVGPAFLRMICITQKLFHPQSFHYGARAVRRPVVEVEQVFISILHAAGLGFLLRQDLANVVRHEGTRGDVIEAADSPPSICGAEHLQAARYALSHDSISTAGFMAPAEGVALIDGKTTVRETPFTIVGEVATARLSTFAGRGIAAVVRAAAADEEARIAERHRPHRL
eukprot:scaffold247_cov274-Pinguiococcus_pyrenoidosus.AAC.21